MVHCCGCKILNCKDKRCKCFKNNRPCISCGCGLACKNPFQSIVPNTSLNYPTGQGKIYDNDKSAPSISFNLDSNSIKKDENNYCFCVTIPIKESDAKDIAKKVQSLVDASSKKNIAIVFGINKKIKCSEPIDNEWSQKLIDQMPIDQIEKIGVPVLLKFYRWGSYRGVQNSCQYTIIKAIKNDIDSCVTEREKTNRKNFYDAEDKKHSYPYGQSREFLHKCDDFLNFIQRLKELTGGIVYVHSQDSDFTSLSLKTFDPVHSTIKPSIDLPFYDLLSLNLKQHKDTKKKDCLVYGGSYNHFQCMDDPNWTQLIKRLEISYLTNLSVTLSNETKHLLSLISPISVYYSEANFIYLSPNCMDKIFADRFHNSHFGDENETKEFLECFFKGISVDELKSLIVYDPKLTVSTSTVRPGKNRGYTVTESSIKLTVYNQKKNKLEHVKTSSIRGCPQTINGTKALQDALLRTFQFKKKGLINGNFKRLISNIIKKFDQVNKKFEFDIKKEMKKSIIEVYGDDTIIQVIEKISQLKYSLFSQVVDSFE